MMQAALELALMFVLISFVSFTAGMIFALMTEDWRDG